MEGEEIGLVLARAAELRCKVSSCIRSAAADQGDAVVSAADAEDDDEEYPNQDENLAGIRDALESLEQQLATLQALQQQQRYERLTILNQIDQSRKVLLNKLREYKGEDLEVIHEASTFASETVEYDDSLILPPYLNDITDTLLLHDLYPADYLPKPKPTQNGVASSKTLQGDINGKISTDGCDASVPRSSLRHANGLRSIIGWITKSAITVIAVASVVGIAQHRLGHQKCGIRLDIQGFSFGKSALGERPQAPLPCPPGKMLMMEDGKPGCVVKERVVIPFDTVVTPRDVKYGFG